MARIAVPVERMDDQALLTGFADGSGELAVAFVRRFQGHVYGVALAVVGDTARAEDVAQRAFERAWRHARRFDPDKASVRTWLTTITRNLAIDSIRVRTADPVDPIDLVRLLGPADAEPEVRLGRSETVRVLREAIRRLPAEQARALVMAGLYGLTAEEVAAAEGIPLGTAKSRIRMAMTKLRNQLVIEDKQ